MTTTETATITEINQMTFNARVEMSVPGDETANPFAFAALRQIVWQGVVEQTSFDALAKFLGVMSAAYSAEVTDIRISDYDGEREQVIEWSASAGYTYCNKTGETALLAWAAAFNAAPESDSFNS